MLNMLNGIKLTKLTDATGAGTSTINGGIVDMAGYEGVIFFTNLATANSGNLIKVQQGQASNLSDAADLAGSGQTSGASDEVVAVDVFKPLERYLRPVIVRGASTTIGEIWAMQYGCRSRPQSNVVSGTINSRTLVSPAEGTA